jgi:hypothetical protein
MIAKLLFGLGVRILGLTVLYRGLEALPIAGSQFCRSAPRGEWEEMLASVLMAAWPLAVACWLVRGAPRLPKAARHA